MWILSSLCFLLRYNVLVRHLPDNANNIKCQQMLLKFDPQAKDWQMGHSKVCVCVCVCVCMCVHARIHVCVCISGLMIMASHQTFSGQNKHLSSLIKFDQTNLLSMEKSLSLLKIIKVHTIFCPYHKN